jgi:hypothetical protein
MAFVRRAGVSERLMTPHRCVAANKAINIRRGTGVATVEDLERYLNEIVAPTVDDFRRTPSNVRIGFLTCVAIDHSVDYLAFPRDPTLWDGKEHQTKRAGLRKQFKEENEGFRLASEVANAFKHVKTTSKRGLEAAEVYERPPAMAGRMMAGVSMVGDAMGAVVVDGHNLLMEVTEALRFLRLKTTGQPRQPPPEMKYRYSLPVAASGSNPAAAKPICACLSGFLKLLFVSARESQRAL